MDSVCWTAIGGASSAEPIEGSAGRYMSIENGPSMESDAISAASDHERVRASVMASVDVIPSAARDLLLHRLTKRKADPSLRSGDSSSLTLLGMTSLPGSRRRARERCIHRRTIELGREARDEIVDVAAQERAAAKREPCRRRREQMRGVELLEAAVTLGVVRHLRDDAHAHAHLDVCLDHVGIERFEHDVRRQSFGIERRID